MQTNKVQAGLRLAEELATYAVAATQKAAAGLSYAADETVVLDIVEDDAMDSDWLMP